MPSDSSKRDGGAAFTPGPWEVGEPPFGEPEYVYCDDGTGSAVATVDLRWVSRSDAERAANARLIAAAPELYATGEQSAIQLDEAANVVEGHGLTSLASIFRAQAEKQRDALSAARTKGAE